MARPARGSIEIVNRKDGLRTFWARITVDGRRHRVRLGTDRDGWTAARAQVELEEQIKTVHAGTWGPPERPAAGDGGDPTFRTDASSWLEDNMLEWRPRTVTDVKWRLESHLPPLIGEDVGRWPSPLTSRSLTAKAVAGRTADGDAASRSTSLSTIGGLTIASPASLVALARTALTSVACSSLRLRFVSIGSNATARWRERRPGPSTASKGSCLITSGGRAASASASRSVSRITRPRLD